MGLKGGRWFNASSQPCNVLQNPFSHFFYCEILVWKKIVFVEFVNSLLDVNFLLIMMWNVTCLCKKLQIWDMGFCHCWISLTNIVKDLQKTQVEYCWIRPKLAFWCYFFFSFNLKHCLSLKLSDLTPTVLMHGSTGKMSTTIEGKQRIWWYEKVREKKKRKKKKKLEERVTEGMERG